MDLRQRWSFSDGVINESTDGWWDQKWIQNFGRNNLEIKKFFDWGKPRSSPRTPTLDFINRLKVLASVYIAIRTLN